MQILYRTNKIEYRDPFGKDQVIGLEIWGKPESKQVILLLFDLPKNYAFLNNKYTPDEFIKLQTKQAVDHMSCTLLPYLIKPDSEIFILVLSS